MSSTLSCELSAFRTFRRLAEVDTGCRGDSHTGYFRCRLMDDRRIRTFRSADRDRSNRLVKRLRPGRPSKSAPLKTRAMACPKGCTLVPVVVSVDFSGQGSKPQC